MAATVKQLTYLKRMLGIAPENRKSSWGCRNWYCVPTGSTFEAELMAMVDLGLVFQMQRVRVDTHNVYFHATLAGAMAAGLDENFKAR